MSDFIGRVAARAAGERAAALPRVPSLFESQGTSSDPELEVIEQEVVAPAPSPRRTPAVVKASPPGQDVEPRGPSIAEGAVSAEIDASPAPEPPEQFAPASPAPARREQPARAPVDAPPGQARLRPGRETHAPVIAVASPSVTPAVRAVRGARAPDMPPPAPAAVAEQPAVRVHIGRLEVRANLQEPARQQPRPEPRRPLELSLGDYLRGKRDPE